MTTLPLFWRLSSASKTERIDASLNLISTLEHFQSQFISPDTSEDESEPDAPKNDGLDALNAQDVAYSIRRLVRGLSSPRESSRLGFAVALTELLSRINTVTCSQIIALILESSKTQGSMTGQEERDVLFARLFGLTAVIQSSLLVRTTPLPSSASSTTIPSSLSDYQEVLSQLMFLGQKKSWLRESAWWTLDLAIDAVQNSSLSWKQAAIDYTIQRTFIEDTSWPPEKVAMTLKLQKMYPNKNWRELVAPFKDPDLLATGNLTALARILKECPSDEDDENKGLATSARSWTPRLHFVWSRILDCLLPGPDDKSPSKGSFGEFFRLVVDESLFSANASAERKYWGFEVFKMALPHMDASTMPMLFTKNFMRCWINHLSQMDRYLHKVAMQLVAEIQTQVQQNPKLGFTLILQFTGVHGSHQFDKLTKTKTVETILRSMDAQGISAYTEYLTKQVNEGTEAERRIWIVDHFAALIRNSSIPKADEWIRSILDWFVVHGLFIIQKTSKKSPYDALRTFPSPPFSDHLRQSCRTRLLSCLADLMSHTATIKIGDKTQKINGVAYDGEFWVSKVQRTIEHLEQDTKHLKRLVELDDDDRSSKGAQDMIKNLQKVTGPQREAARGAELLLAATLVLRQCDNVAGRTDEEHLEACVDACTRMFFDESPEGRHQKKLNGDHAYSPPEPVDVFVDTIIGHLDKSPVYMRSIANHAFSLLCDHVKESTINLILAQLERRNPTELAKEDEDEKNESDDGTNHNDSGEEESGNDRDSSTSGDEDPDLELREKIKAVLQANSTEASTDDSGGESSEEELMDDDHMMAIDEQLAAVFRERANSKKSTKRVDVQRQATHFKNRILDLVDIFFKKQATSPHLIRCVLPLIDLITNTSTDERQLADKARNVIRSRIGKLKEIPSTYDREILKDIFKELHIRARKAQSREVLETLSQLSLYTTRLLLHMDEEGTVLDVYHQSLLDYISRKNSALGIGFFEEFFRRYSVIVWKVRFDILNLNTKATNMYRRCQVFHLVQILLTRISTDDLGQDVLQFMPSLRQSLYELISSSCCDGRLLTIQQLKSLFKLGLYGIRQTKRIISTSEELCTIWHPESWKEVREKMINSKRLKASTTLQNMCQQMVQLSEMSSTNVVIKHKADDTSEDEGRKRKKFKKKSK